VTPADLPADIAAKITVDPVTGCWLWRGNIRRGYGLHSWGGRPVQASRLVFHLLADPSLPVSPGRYHHAGGSLDHATCQTPSCVNPEHLERVSHRENVLRGAVGVLGEHSSKFVGVTWYRRQRRWRAAIQVGGRSHHLGHFVDEADAARAYDAAAALLHGDATNHRLGRLAEPPTALALDAARERLFRARAAS